MAGAAAASWPGRKMWPLAASPAANLGFALTDVSQAAGLAFHHNSGSYGGKLLPETLGSGCAFLDYDADGWQDILTSQWDGLARTPKGAKHAPALPK